MKMPKSSVDLMRRIRNANMKDTARIYSFEVIRLPGGGMRRGPEVDVATSPCQCSPLDMDTIRAGAQDLPASRYVINLPIALRGVVAQEHLIEVTSAEFGWTKHFEIVEPPQAYHTDEIVVKCFCVETNA